MTLEQWLEDARSDAYRRKLPALADLIEGLAQSTAALRAADWNDDAEAGLSAVARDDNPARAKADDVAPTLAYRTVRAKEGAAATISALAPQSATGTVRAERLTEEALETISRLNPRLNAFITVTADEALAIARDCDKDVAGGRHRGPLHGIPLSIKDLIDVAGYPTTAASKLRDQHRAAEDAPVVRHVRAAGAVLVGKTNLHEFAFGTTTEDSAWGAARHPADASRSPGGSSGGSAIAVHTGMSIASVATDTGGSIRIPAAACGIVGG